MSAQPFFFYLYEWFSEAANEDTAECWNRRLNVYVRNTSFLTGPSQQCINQYADDVSLARGKKVIFDKLYVNKAFFL